MNTKNNDNEMDSLSTWAAHGQRMIALSPIFLHLSLCVEGPKCCCNNQGEEVRWICIASISRSNTDHLL